MLCWEISYWYESCKSVKKWPGIFRGKFVFFFSDTIPSAAVISCHVLCSFSKTDLSAHVQPGPTMRSRHPLPEHSSPVQPWEAVNPYLCTVAQSNQNHMRSCHPLPEPSGPVQPESHEKLPPLTWAQWPGPTMRSCHPLPEHSRPVQPWEAVTPYLSTVAWSNHEKLPPLTWAQ